MSNRDQFSQIGETHIVVYTSVPYHVTRTLIFKKMVLDNVCVKYLKSILK